MLTGVPRSAGLFEVTTFIARVAIYCISVGIAQVNAMGCCRDRSTVSEKTSGRP